MRNPSPAAVYAGLPILTAMLLFGGCDFDASVSYSKNKGDYDQVADAEPVDETEGVTDPDPEFQCSSDEDCNQPFEICIKGF